jgi:hypothetical protein
MRSVSFVLLVLLHFHGAPAMAWSRPGHMVTAAIVYDELSVQDPTLVRELMEIMKHHPDRGAFEVAAGRSNGEDRNRRIFMEMARWPDDIRGGSHDHPTWHYSARPLVDREHPPAIAPRGSSDGAAREALALNLSVAADPPAPASDRAVALCWIFHIIGDIHQPLHSASLFSQRFPDGDRGGSLQFVLDPNTQQAITLHWFWDDRVNQDGDPRVAVERATEIQRRYPRAQLSELRHRGNADFDVWAGESFDVAAQLVYGADYAAGDSALTARTISDRYLADATAAAERRLAVSSYRLADMLRGILGQPKH